jgi:hypothetical protein
MKKWVAPILMIGAALLVLIFRSTNLSLLTDSDTKVLLATIRAKQDPMLWFRGDWPLYNHFYRPISTLVFEMDNALYRDWAGGYAWTNAILVAICVGLTGWLSRELTGKPWMGAVSAWLFALWATDQGSLFAEFGWAGFLILIIGAIRHPKRPWLYISAALATWYVGNELMGISLLWYRNVGWIPGRTATTMTVFCLTAMAAYARWERLSPLARPVDPPTPLTPPATRSTRLETVRHASIGWLILAVAAVALALGSYEQAVMLPACLVGIGVAFRLQRFPARRGWVTFHAACWVLLLGYLALRHQILPPKTSGYQEQQLRYGAGVWIAISTYLYPFAGQYQSIVAAVEAGPLMWLSPTPYTLMVEAIKPAAMAYWARFSWVVPALAFALSILAYLPMAWLQQFDHYHFWPSTLRAIFVVTLLPLVLKAWVTAASPQPIATPPRSHPAPGSLPRP